MKKLAAILLILTMIAILTLASAGYADEHSSVVTMTVGDIYDYSATSTVSMTRNGGSGDVTFNVSQLEAGHSLMLSLSSANPFEDGNKEFSLSAAGSLDYIKYKIKYDGNTISEGDPFAKVTTTGETKVPLFFVPSTIPDGVTSGQYSDIITYIVTVNTNTDNS